MKPSGSFLITALGAALLAFTTVATAVGQSGGQQQSTGNPADDPANDLFIQTCNRCHDAARITALRRTKTEWEEVINKMIERGATGSEEDFMTVFGYLRRHYGKVYINTAPIDEITTTPGPHEHGRRGHRRLPEIERKLRGLRRAQEGPEHRRQDPRGSQGRRRFLAVLN
jgi:hypothetical protein